MLVDVGDDELEREINGAEAEIVEEPTAPEGAEETGVLMESVADEVGAAVEAGSVDGVLEPALATDNADSAVSLVGDADGPVAELPGGAADEETVTPGVAEDPAAWRFQSALRLRAVTVCAP